MIKSIIAILFSVSLSAIAHEGHHHAPGVAPQKGGMVRTLETLNLEVLHSGNNVKVYVYDLKLKPLKAASYKVSAQVKVPKKKAQDIKLDVKNDYWTFDFDAKGAHRFTLIFNIEQGGHKDKIKWNLEPQHSH